MTLTQAKRLLAKHGVSIKRTEYDEYRVNMRHASERTAYYTNDLEDAVQTGLLMAATSHTSNHSHQDIN